MSLKLHQKQESNLRNIFKQVSTRIKVSSANETVMMQVLLKVFE